MATPAQRQHLAALMDWLVHHEKQIHYAQFRPMRTRSLLEQPLADQFGAGHAITTDCSETVTLLCRLAGLADPNGLNYDGFGFTGTMLSHLENYTNPVVAGIGALVVFGPGQGDHVCMVRTPGNDPYLFSHGGENGPVFVRFSLEKAAHKPPATFLSIAEL